MLNSSVKRQKGLPASHLHQKFDPLASKLSCQSLGKHRILIKCFTDIDKRRVLLVPALQVKQRLSLHDYWLGSRSGTHDELQRMTRADQTHRLQNHTCVINILLENPSAIPIDPIPRQLTIRFDFLLSSQNDWCFRPRFCSVRLYWAGEPIVILE